MAMSFAVGCNKELPVEAPEAAGEIVVLTATIGDQDSKAVLKENKTEWEAGDKVTVHNGTKGFEFAAKSAGATTDLTYTGNDFSGEKFIAVYPSGNYTADVDKKTVVANIPTYQSSRNNSFNESAALAVAYTESNNLAFKHAVSLLKFTVKGNNIKGLIFYGNNGEGISGDVKVTLNAKSNAVMSVVPQETEITENDVTETKLVTWAKLWADTPDWCFDEGVTYYMAVAPQYFSKGFTAQLEVADVGNKDVKKYSKGFELEAGKIYDLGELSYDGSADAPAASDWVVAGTFNGWSTTANPMILEDGYYVVKNVTGLNYTAPTEEGKTESATGFKFIYKGDWKGSVGMVTTGKWEFVWDKDNGTNIYVDGASAADAFDIYVNPAEGNNGKFVVVAANQPMPEDKDASSGSDTPETPATPGQDSGWALAGTFNGWGNAVFKTTEIQGLFVVSNLTFEAYDEIKVKKADSWDVSYGGGIKNLNSNKWMKVYSGGSNIPVTTAGTYDVYFDLNNTKLYLMTAGTSYTSATEQSTDGQGPASQSWYIVGNFNSWNPGDAAYKMTDNGTYYVFKNFTAQSGCLLKFAPGKWSGDKGGTNQSFATGTWFKTGSDNISVDAGTYDIYLKKDQSEYKFVAPGQNP